MDEETTTTTVEGGVAVIGDKQLDEALERVLAKYFDQGNPAGLTRALGLSQRVSLDHYLDACGGEVKSLDQLLHVRVDPKGGDGVHEQVAEFQKASDRLVLVDQLLNPRWHSSKGTQGIRVDPKSLKSWQRMERAAERLGKSFNTTTNTAFIAEGWSPQLIELVEAERALPSLLEPITLADTAPMNWPVEGIAGNLPYIVNEGTGDTGQKVPSTSSGTTKLTVDPDAIGLRIVVTEKASEASIIAAEPYILRQLVRAHRWGEEELILNGDTTTPHMDAAVTSASDVRKLRKGLRRTAIDNSAVLDVDAGSGHWSPRTAILLRAKMDLAYRTQRADLAWVLSGMAEDLIVGDTTNWPNFQLLYAIGEARAANILGGVRELFGSPTVVSPAMAETMDANGYNTGLGALSGVVVFSRSAWGFARAGGLRTEVIWDGEALQFKVVVHEYIDLVKFRAADKSEAYGYNVVALAAA